MWNSGTQLFSRSLRAWAHRGRRTTLLYAIVLLITGGAALAQAPPATEHDGYKKVLVIYSTRRDAPYTIVVENVLRETINDGLAGRLDYYTEYIDFSRFSGPDYQSAIREFLQRKYAGLRPDVIIADGGTSFEFLVKHRSDVFPDVPMVFSTEQRDFRPIPNSTGVLYALDMQSTLNIALQLHPHVKRVFVIHGASEFDAFYEQIARQQFREHEARVAIDYLSPMPLDKLQQFVAALPADSIIYFASFFEDGAGHKFIPQEILARLSRVANAPLYCWPEMTLGLGIVGGDLLSEQNVAQQTAALALRVLRGESPDAIPRFESRPYVRVFDWQQLRRWRISEDRLPPGSLVQFKEESFWSLYRWRIIATGSFMAAQALLIVGLIVNRVRRGRAEKALRASHNRIEYLARRLIVAQDEERKHIARELHDDVSQQVAALSIDLSNLKRQCSAAGDPIRDQIAALQESAARLSERVHRLSHDLHSSTLEHAGLAATIRAYCKEFSSREGIAVSLTMPEALDPIGADAALCLYRVTQESLRNAAKHSGSPCIEVELRASSACIELRVADRGRGFDQTQAAAGGGLGLASMEERLKLLGGTLRVHAQPGAGTTRTRPAAIEHSRAMPTTSSTIRRRNMHGGRSMRIGPSVCSPWSSRICGCFGASAKRICLGISGFFQFLRNFRQQVAYLLPADIISRLPSCRLMMTISQ